MDATARKLRSPIEKNSASSPPEAGSVANGTDLARAGAAAAFATAVSTDFSSDRIGCQIHQPIYGISLGALCVRD